MDNAHLLSTPIVVQSLDPKKDPFHSKEDDEEILGPKVSYFNATNVLLYLAQSTKPYIEFFVSLLARFNLLPIH